MPVKNKDKTSETVTFELNWELPYPFAELAAGDEIAINCFWKSPNYYWLRLDHPQSQQGFDFRILKIYRFLEHTHLALLPARRWSQRRPLTEAIVVRLMDDLTVCGISETDLHALKESLHFEENFQILENAEYQSVMEDQLVRALGSYRNWDDRADAQALALTQELTLEGKVVDAEQELEIDLDTTINDPGFLKLKTQDSESTFRIAAYFESDKKSYLAVKQQAERTEDFDLPEVTIVELKSKHLVKTLSQEEFAGLADKIMDALETSQV